MEQIEIVRLLIGVVLLLFGRKLFWSSSARWDSWPGWCMPRSSSRDSPAGCCC
jgi:hypothetical protein